jgi:hypothetical protein
MPPLPIIADTFRCAYNWRCADGTHAVNVMHIRAPGHTQFEVGPAIQAATSHDMWVSVHLSAHVESIDVTPLDGAGLGVSFIPTDDSVFTGTGGLDWIPSTSALLKFTTALRGRSFRGRMFLPFTSEESAVNGALLGSSQALMQADWTSFLVNMNASGFEPVVASYTLAVAHTIQFVEVEAALATQRRRQERVRAA